MIVKMNWREAEKILREHFNKQGYKMDGTGSSYDHTFVYFRRETDKTTGDQKELVKMEKFDLPVIVEFELY